MAKRIAEQIQGGGLRRIAALFGHSDNAGDARRNRVSLAGLSPTSSHNASILKTQLIWRIHQIAYFCQFLAVFPGHSFGALEIAAVV